MSNHLKFTLLLLALTLPATNPFIPSHHLSIKHHARRFPSFPFYASDQNRQRKISINFDQNVSIRKATRGEDGDGSNAAPDSNGNQQDPPKKRRRKRDILADSLSSILVNPNQLPPLRADTYDLWAEEISFRKPGEKMEMPNFLSLEEEAALNSTYEEIVTERMREVEAEYEMGAYGPNVTMDEARRIVEYVIGLELQNERDKLNEEKSIQMLKQYEAEAARREEEMVADILSEGPDKILDRDPIAREIVTDLLEEKEEDAELKRKIEELQAYKEQLMEKEQDVAVEATRAILEKNTNPNIDMIDVYNEVVERIQKDRREKLSGPTLGVLGDTIELEEAKEYGLQAREEADRERMAREDAVAKGWCDPDGVDAFFEEPKEYAEVKMFQSIVRSIVLNRPMDPTAAEAGPAVEAEETAREPVVAEKDGTDDDGVGEGAVGDDSEEEDIEDDEASYFGYGRPMIDRFLELEAEEKKWTLSASEKAEAFKLYNDWKEFEKERKQAERELEPEDAPTKQIGLNTRANPLFLYTEDSERTRKFEQQKLEKALRRQLQADDDIEKSSNELLMKELLEGGYTKERSLRLIDKLISKSDDKVIKDALMDIKTSVLDSKDEDYQVEKEAPERPLFVNKEVDLSKVFTRDEEDEREIPTPPKPESRTTAPPVEREDQKWRTQKIEVPMDEDDDDDLPDLDSYVEPPKTAFFDSFDREAEASREKTTSELFGSYDDQSFERFAARTGATTEEEKAELRRNLAELEELKAKGRAEIEARDVERESARLGIDTDNLDAEDLNSDQIDALLSRRSALRPKDAERKPGAEAAPQAAEKKREIIAGSDGTLKKMETGETDYISQAYRAISGGDTDDEDEYRDLLKFQEEGLKNLEAEPVEVPDDFDIDKYADETLSGMKSFAALRDVEEGKKQMEVAFEGDAVYTEDDADEYSLEFDMADDDQPSWLSLEQQEQGTAQKKADSDSKFDSKEYQQQVEENQKLADEFLKQQSGGVVDIAEVLDRPYFGSMDAPDDYTKKKTIFSSYEARKEELMQYTTLRLEDIINFVDWKRDPASTGVNQYLMEVQRPFSEYGALFRLEGCIVELIGMQAKAWEKVSERFGYRIQSEEDVRKASLYAPAKAIRDVFGWTNDVVEIEEIVKAHHSELNAAFNDWLEHDRTFVYPRDPTRRNNSGLKKSGPSKDEVYETYTLAWSKLAQGKGKTPPTKDQVASGIKIRDWEVAVPNIFGWSEYTGAEVYGIVVEYDGILQAEMEALNQKYAQTGDAAAGSTLAAKADRPKPSKDEINTIYSLAWNKLARQIGQDPPTKEQVMQGLRLRDWEVTVKDVFGWDYSANKIYEIVFEYDKIVQEDFKTLNKNYGLDYGFEDKNKYPDVIMREGVTEWLDKLRSVDMKFAVLSHLGRSQLDAILDVTGLADYFPPDMRVTLEERYSDERSELLGGALRVEKLPERCVLFDNAPSAAVEAHEVLMKCVSFVDQYAKYELLAADWTIGEYWELDISSIRSLFSIRDDNVPLAVAEARGDLDRLPPRIKTGYQWDEGDR